MWVLDNLFQVVFHRTAAALIPFVTGGRARVQPFLAYDGGFNWAGYKRDETGRIVIDALMGSYLGLLIWATLLVVGLACIR